MNTTTAEEIISAYPHTSSFAWKIVEVSEALGIDASWLANTMRSESNLNPKALNDSKGSSGTSPPSYAAGLIQWIPSTAKSVLKKLYGTTYSSNLGTGTTTSRHGDTLSEATEKILSMSALEQMDLVYEYMKMYTPLSSQNEVILSVFYPVALRKDDDFDIADHYAAVVRGHERGSSAYWSSYNYLKDLNGGIYLRGDYYKKFEEYWKLEPKPPFGEDSGSGSGGDILEKALSVGIIGVTAAILLSLI